MEKKEEKGGVAAGEQTLQMCGRTGHSCGKSHNCKCTGVFVQAVSPLELEEDRNRLAHPYID